MLLSLTKLLNYVNPFRKGEPYAVKASRTVREGARARSRLFHLVEIMKIIQPCAHMLSYIANYVPKQRTV